MGLAAARPVVGSCFEVLALAERVLQGLRRGSWVHNIGYLMDMGEMYMGLGKLEVMATYGHSQ